MTSRTHPRKRGDQGVILADRRWGIALLAGAALALPAGNMAAPQSSDHPTISIAAVSAAPAAEVPFHIRIAPEASVPRSSFIKVKGLPSMAALSDGHSTAPGSWAIPLGALTGLKLTLPAKAAGKFEVVVTLVATDGSVLDEARTTLDIRALATAKPAAPQGRPETTTIMASRTPPEPPNQRSEGAGRSSPAAAPVMSGKERDRAMKLFREGNELMADGNVSAARLVYELAAEAGLAPAAMALAGTYDDAELARLKVRGVQADAREAKRWYERARQLGDTAAELRLQRLGPR